MTKVIKKMVKCSKCEKESEQLLVFSVNFLLGTKEDNERLMSHKQKCPYCGYEASDISVNTDNLFDKYVIESENNISQEVYGVSDSKNCNITNKPIAISKDARIEMKISRDNNEYVMTFNPFSENVVDLTFADVKNLDEKSISDISTQIPMQYYSKFIERLTSITKDWNKSYDGLENISWMIRIEENSNVINYTGSGSYPNNWNEFMDLVIEYEIIFKQKKLQDINVISNTDEKDMTFEELVKKQFEDPFWAEVVIKYFREQLKSNDTVSKIVFSDIKKYKDILNEFAKCLVQKTYDLPDALEINGYTAKMISELNPSFEVSGVYSFMKTLRDKKEYALKTIKEGFPNKDVELPIIIPE